MRLRIVDSLQTFLKVKCRVTHQLAAKEEIILGIMSANEERVAEAEQVRACKCMGSVLRWARVSCYEVVLLSSGIGACGILLRHGCPPDCKIEYYIRTEVII